MMALAMRHDAAEDHRREATRSALLAFGHSLLIAGPFQHIADEAARRTAASAQAQTAKALKIDPSPVPPTRDLDTFGPDAIDRMGELMGESIDRGFDVLDDWDEGDLSDELTDGLDGIFGKALQWSALAFGYLFGQSVRASQEEAGVGSYVWLTMMDSHVRPAHAALDEVLADWDEPPLKAADSDNGEDCNPGDDWGCRCVSSPIPPDYEIDTGA